MIAWSTLAMDVDAAQFGKLGFTRSYEACFFRMYPIPHVLCAPSSVRQTACSTTEGETNYPWTRVFRSLPYWGINWLIFSVHSSFLTELRICCVHCLCTTADISIDSYLVRIHYCCTRTAHQTRGIEPAQSQTDTKSRSNEYWLGGDQRTQKHRAAALTLRERLQLCSSKKSLQLVRQNSCSLTLENVSHRFEILLYCCTWYITAVVSHMYQIRTGHRMALRMWMCRAFVGYWDTAVPHTTAASLCSQSTRATNST